MGVSPAPPSEVREIRPVRDAEVLEGNEKPLVNCLPQPKFDGDPPPKELGDVLIVHALRRCREPEQLFRLKSPEEATVARRGRVVELIDDDDVEVLWTQGRDGLFGQRLDHGEDMRAGGYSAATMDLTERAIAKHRAEGRA